MYGILNTPAEEIEAVKAVNLEEIKSFYKTGFMGQIMQQSALSIDFNEDQSDQLDKGVNRRKIPNEIHPHRR